MRRKTGLRRGIGLFLASVLVVGSGQAVPVHAAPTEFPAAFTKQEQSLIVNSDFEGEDNFVTNGAVSGKWYLWNNSEKVSDTVHGGSGAIRLPSSGSAVDQRVTLRPDTEYELSVWVWAEDGKGARVRAFLNGGATQEQKKLLDTEARYGEWVQYTNTFTTDADTTYANVGVVRAHNTLGVDGNVWVDDFTIREKNAPLSAERADAETIKVVFPEGRSSLDGSDVGLLYGIGEGAEATRELECSVAFDEETHTATVTHANVSEAAETEAAFRLTVCGETFTQTVTLPANPEYTLPELESVLSLENGSVTVKLAGAPSKELTAQQISITYTDYDGTEVTASVSKLEKIDETTYRAEFNRIPSRETDHEYTLTISIGGVSLEETLTVMTTKGKTFYLDATGGDDSNDGTSPERAWQTLDKVNETVFMEGSSLLLKSGETWTGTLWPKGSGSEDAPITLSSYGTGDRPRILMDEDASYNETVMRIAVEMTRKVNETFRLHNQSFWEISNIEFQNPNYEENQPEDTNRALERGMYITAQDVGQLDHIYIDNVWIHGFQTSGGTNQHKESGGIVFFISASKTEAERVPTWFSDLRITNCTVEDVGRSGFFLLSPWKTREMTDSGQWGGRWTMVNNAGEGSLGEYTPTTDVYFGQNIFRNISGDGIILQCMDQVVAEYNLVDSTCTGNWFAAGVFPYLVSNATVRYNELARTYRGGDAQGIEVDALNENVAVVYNYSHENAGGFVQFCALENLPSYDSYYAYNISENDGSIGQYPGLLMPRAGTVNCSVFNNTVYFNPSGSVDPDGQDSFFSLGSYNKGARTSLAVYNNIFYRTDESPYTFDSGEQNLFNSMEALAADNVVAQGDGVKFADNLFYNFNTTGLDTSSAFYQDNIWGEDPLLGSPGTMGDGDADALLTGKDITAAWDLDAYTLGAGSPAIGAGRPIRAEYASIPDMLGNPVDAQAPDLGAIQFADESSVTINITLDKQYDGNAVTLTEEDIQVSGSAGEVSFTWYSVAADGTETQLAEAPKNAGDYKVVVTVAADGVYSAATLEQGFSIARAVPSYTVPTGVKATEGETLNDVQLPAGFTWQDASLSVGTAGTNHFMAVYTPADTANFETVTGISVAVEVAAASGGTGQTDPPAGVSGNAGLPAAAQSSGNTPKTGDAASAGFLAAGLMVSGLAVLLAGMARKRKIR